MRYTIAKKKQGWNLVPETKNKPNAQGTLFRAPVTARTPESRQPRGYSPERYAEVRGTLNGKVVTNEGRSLSREKRRSTDELARSLSRSTVPIERIASVNRWSTEAPLTTALGEHHASESDTYIKLQAKAHRSSYVVSHELGHEESYRAAGNQRAYSTDHEQGAEEGFADQYATGRAFHPGYKKRPEKMVSGHEERAWRDHAGEFGKGYLDVRFPVHTGRHRSDRGYQDSLFEVSRRTGQTYAWNE